MDDQSVASLVSRMAALVETFDRRCEHTSEQLREMVERYARGAAADSIE